MKFIESVKKMLPGCAIALVIAVVAKFLEHLEESVGLHLIGASVIAMFIGMIVNRFYAPNDKTKPGIKFTSKKILKFAIILLGASLNITTVLTVGKFSLTVMLFTLATCFGLGYVIGKALGLDWKTSSLINAGTGICGGSAIAAIAPVIEATDMDIAYGMSATFLFDTIMVVVFPQLARVGHCLQGGEHRFELFAPALLVPRREGEEPRKRLRAQAVLQNAEVHTAVVAAEQLDELGDTVTASRRFGADVVCGGRRVGDQMLAAKGALIERLEDVLKRQLWIARAVGAQKVANIGKIRHSGGVPLSKSFVYHSAFSSLSQGARD